MTKRLFVIDAMALAYRSYFAFGRSSLATSRGRPTGAIYGSAMFLNKLIAEQRPDYLLAATDTHEKTFRHEMFEAYKGTRDKMPDELTAQIPEIFKLFGLFRCKMIRVPGVEADDIIGTVARRFATPELDVYIVSGDKDFLQLVNEHVKVLAPKKNEEALLIDVAGVKERYGVTPEQVVDMLALVGDTVDNVPGVKGIGEKGAAQLIEKYGSLDGIYARIGEITAKKQREGLESCRDDAYLSQRLVTLKTDVALPVGLDDIAIDPAEAVANTDLLAFYEDFEFKSLVTRVNAGIKARAAGGDGKKGKGAKGAAAATTKSEGDTVATPEGETQAVVVEREFVASTEARDALGFGALTSAVAGTRSYAIAVHATSSDLIEGRAAEVAIATPTGNFRVPLTEEGIYRLRPLLLAPGKTIIGHGLKVATQMLGHVGLDLGSSFVDIEINDYLLDPNNYDHSVVAASTRLDLPWPVEGDLAGHAAAAFAVEAKQRPLIEERGLQRVQREVDLPLVPVLAGIEQAGFYVDAVLLAKISDELALECARLETELTQAIGRPFNVNSPKQLQALLFEELKLQDDAGIKRMKRTKTGFSTDESVLARLAKSHPIPRLILEYRGVTKLKNTYVDTLPQFINPRTGRIHSSLNQTVAATGRLSSDKPNLQNIPMRTAQGRRIREAFRPQVEGDRLISADYSQVEIRLLAHMASDDGLIEAFERGLDVHTVTAAKIFRVDEDKVDSVLRSRAKAVNFGIIYGMGPQRLAQETGVTMTEAKDFITRYFEVYPGIKKFTESLLETARSTGYCTTLLGRRRPIPEIRESNNVVRARGENIAVNAPIQGTAADLIKLAMIKIAAELHKRRMKTRMLLQVHDELVFSAPASEVDAATEIVREGMETALTTRVPLKVDVKSGRTWLEAH